MKTKAYPALCHTLAFFSPAVENDVQIKQLSLHKETAAVSVKLDSISRIREISNI